jgi:hypothetical protein
VFCLECGIVKEPSMRDGGYLSAEEVSK